MRVLSVAVIALACATPAFGQAPGPADLEPGVNTSALPAQSSAAAPGAVAPAAPGAEAPGGRSATSVSAATTGNGAPDRSKATAAARKAARTGKAMDRIDLDTTDITGNKELPKVMYVVPWKRADLGDLTGKPANSLVDEVLQPVDRDVFNREERYYHTVAPQTNPPEPPAGAPAAP
jgi:hypothetical protein